MTIAGSTEISLHTYETRLRFALFPQLAGMPDEPDDALLRHGRPPMTPSDLSCVGESPRDHSMPDSADAKFRKEEVG